MQQLVQNLKNGTMKMTEVPFPILKQSHLLVRTLYSVISTGTEGRTVKDARASMLHKARSRPDQIDKVIKSIRNNGVSSTLRMVNDKLDSWSPLGYSCCGRVIEIDSHVRDFQIGDLVACGGNQAMHAQVISVPQNLAVRLPEKTNPEHAAFTTLGAIALQGIRQADIRLGETIIVIGLGIVGLLTVQLLKVAGTRVIAIDKSQYRVNLARKIGADIALTRKEITSGSIEAMTDSQGADAVIITASTASTDPVNLAGEFCRPKGKVIIVGNVPTGFQRPSFYKKELDLRMSCSYGPGRYDPDYEIHGLDYPIGFVRWTENRNMQAFVEFLASGQLDPGSLITHRFPFLEANKAYDLVVKDKEPFCAIMFHYPTEKEPQKSIHFAVRKSHHPIGLGFVGAGSFARNILLPNLPKDLNCRGLLTAQPHNARTIAEKYHFDYCTPHYQKILQDPAINVVMIATQHHLHAEYVIQALKAGKHVFVEKPLCLNRRELAEIEQTLQKSRSHLMVGFNRRFHPLVNSIKERLGSRPKAFLYRINAGAVDKKSWIMDPNLGGGRILGEVCHFVDLLCYLSNSRVRTIYASSLNYKDQLADTLTLNLNFTDGSIATLLYCSKGNNRLNKEYLEIFDNGTVMLLSDFKRLSIKTEKKHTKKTVRTGKGHQQELTQFFKAVQTKTTSPIPYAELKQSTLITFDIIDSIRQNKTIHYDEHLESLHTNPAQIEEIDCDTTESIHPVCS
jgi:polar amino acid transport system substrate-binding protein